MKLNCVRVERNVETTWPCRWKSPVYCVVILSSTDIVLSSSIACDPTRRPMCKVHVCDYSQCFLQFSNVALHSLSVHNFSYYTNICTKSIATPSRPPTPNTTEHESLFRPHPKSVEIQQSATENLHRITIMYLFTCTTHSSTVVQFSSGFLSAFFFGLLAVLVLRISHQKHMFLRRFKVLSTRPKRAQSILATIIKSRMHILHTLLPLLSQTNPGNVRKEKSGEE